MAQLLNNAVSGTVDTNAVSLTTSYLISDGLMFGNMFQRYVMWNTTPFLDFLEREKAWRPIEKGFDQNRLVRWHELGFLQRNALIGSFTGGASNSATASITIAASSHTGTDGSSSPFNVGESIRVNNQGMRITAKNTSVPFAHVLTVTPPNGNTTPLNTVLAAGLVMVPAGEYYGDKQGYNISDLRMPQIYSAPIGILKKKKQMGASEAVNAKKVALPPALGDKPLIVYQMDLDNVAEHKKELNNELIFGLGNSYTESDGTLCQEIQGLISQIQARGNDYPYFGSITLQDIYDWTLGIKKNGGSSKYYFKPGAHLYNSVELLLADSLKNGGRIYLNEAEETKRFVDYGFDAFRVGNTTFMYQSFDDFNNPIVGAAPGQNASFNAVLVPMDNVKDAQTGQMYQTMTIAYPEITGPNGTTLNRRYEINKGGENGLAKDSELDVINFRIKSELGFVVQGANMSFYIRKADL